MLMAFSHPPIQLLDTVKMDRSSLYCSAFFCARERGCGGECVGKKGSAGGGGRGG